MGLKKWRHCDIKGFRYLYKKGATFRRAFLPIKKGATIILTLNADG